MHSRPAFTLIELLVAIAILALLLSLSMTTLSSASDRAAALDCTFRLRALSVAAQLYAEDHTGHLPGSSHRPFVVTGIGADVTYTPVAPWHAALPVYLDVRISDRSPALAIDRTDIDLPTATMTDLFSIELVSIRERYRCPFQDRGNQPASPDALGYAMNVYFWLDGSDEASWLDSRALTRLANLPRPHATVVFGEHAGGADHIMAHWWRAGLRSPTAELAHDRHGRTAGAAFLDGHARDVPLDATWQPGPDMPAAPPVLDRWNPLTAR
ncbi:MAG: prepilin-type N-terminal cleavage/methylation domain-containing protein [Planctomycetota bacterium]